MGELTQKQVSQVTVMREQIADTILRNLDATRQAYIVITADQRGNHELINSGDPECRTCLLQAFARGESPIGYLVAHPNRGIKRTVFCGVVLPQYSRNRCLQDFIKDKTLHVNDMMRLQYKMQRDLDPYFSATPGVFGEAAA